jgi:hypothetical protein
VVGEQYRKGKGRRDIESEKIMGNEDGMDTG